MIGALRLGLRTVTVVTLLAAAWLVWVLLTVVPARDPGSAPLWTVVAAGAVAVGLAATLATARPDRVRTPLALLLSVLSAAALAFGANTVLSQLALPPDREGEGYLLLLGLILAAQGLLGLAWLGAVAVDRR
jgi:hypothetical protein